jgi:hypothetical protein
MPVPSGLTGAADSKNYVTIVGSPGAGETRIVKPNYITIFSEDTSAAIVFLIFLNVGVETFMQRTTINTYEIIRNAGEYHLGPDQEVGMRLVQAPALHQPVFVAAYDVI